GTVNAKRVRMVINAAAKKTMIDKAVISNLVPVGTNKIKLEGMFFDAPEEECPLYRIEKFESGNVKLGSPEMAGSKIRRATAARTGSNIGGGPTSPLMRLGSYFDIELGRDFLELNNVILNVRGNKMYIRTEK